MFGNCVGYFLVGFQNLVLLGLLCLFLDVVCGDFEGTFASCWICFTHFLCQMFKTSCCFQKSVAYASCTTCHLLVVLLEICFTEHWIFEKLLTGVEVSCFIKPKHTKKNSKPRHQYQNTKKTPKTPNTNTKISKTTKTPTT